MITAAYCTCCSTGLLFRVSCLSWGMLTKYLISGTLIQMPPFALSHSGDCWWACGDIWGVLCAYYVVSTVALEMDLSISILDVCPALLEVFCKWLAVELLCYPALWKLWERLSRLVKNTCTKFRLGVDRNFITIFGKNVQIKMQTEEQLPRLMSVLPIVCSAGGYL